MCLTPRQYNTTERLNHTVWKTKILQKQMTEIMEDLDECVSNGKYTDGEYLAMSKDIQSEYETYGRLEKLFTRIQGNIKKTHNKFLRQHNGNVDDALSFIARECRHLAPRGWHRGWAYGRFATLSEEEVLSEAIGSFYGDCLVENALEDGGWERQAAVVVGGWELTHELGIQFDDLLENHELYAQRREEGQYYIKEMFERE